MSSRKSSASSTTSRNSLSGQAHAPKKLPPISKSNAISKTSHTSTKLKEDDSSSLKIRQEANSEPNKQVYSQTTREEIDNDKVQKRYRLMMEKLNQLQVEESKLAIKPTTSKQALTYKSNKNASSPLPNSSLNSSNHSCKNGPKQTPTKKLDEKTSAQISKQIIIKKKDKESSSGSDNQSDDDDEDNELRAPIKAPNELLEEFVVYVMGKQWEEAHKLCKFILMYEPNNSIAKEYLPLLEEKLKESDEAETESDDEDEDEETDEDNEEESEDDDDDDDDTDDESDSESGSSENDEDDLKATKRNNDGEKSHDDDDDVEFPGKDSKLRN